MESLTGSERDRWRREGLQGEEAGGGDAYGLRILPLPATPIACPPHFMSFSRNELKDTCLFMVERRHDVAFLQANWSASVCESLVIEPSSFTHPHLSHFLHTHQHCANDKQPITMSDLEDEMPLAALSALKKGAPLGKRSVFHEDDERWGG